MLERQNQIPMLHSLTTWWTFFCISINERLVYRGDFMLGTLMRFLPTLTQIFLWWAIYDVVTQPAIEGVQAAQQATRFEERQIVGYRYGDMVAYFLLVTISRAFSSMPGLASRISGQIRNGEIKRFLIQPVDMEASLLAQRMAHKLVYYWIAALPFALVFFLCRSFFVDGWPSANVLVVFFASLILTFLLGFFLEYCIGLLGFWFLEVGSIVFIFMLMSFMLSGHMFPLELLPSEPLPLRALVDYLPFKYLAYFPAAVFLKKLEYPQMVQGLAIEAAWVVFFFVLSRILWHRGVARFSGYGG
jgi:ABC-2 type transport system permease protein